MWACVAGGGRAASVGNGKVPCSEEVMIFAFGILTRMGAVVGWMLSMMSDGRAKWPVAPVSNTSAGGGEDNRET